jgi:hypothetical protein
MIIKMTEEKNIEKTHGHLLALEQKAEIELQRIGLSNWQVQKMLANALKASAGEFQIIGYDSHLNQIRYRDGINRTDTVSLDYLSGYAD